jgi:predicted nucleotidyltransferase
MQRSIDISGKISGDLLAVLEGISMVSDSLQIPFFVVGATARDIILHYGFGLEIKRATQHVDLGIRVENWEEFGLISEKFIESGFFVPTRGAQRYYFKGIFPVDIVPFGRISEPEETISWPQSEGVEMSTLGFRESYDTSVIVRLRSDPILEVKFASLAGLSAMKLISWKDRYPERKKDAGDFEFIIRNYIDAGNFERIYSGDESDILETDDPDYELMGARLLGRDVAGILSPDSKKYISNILDAETGGQDRYRFVEDMRKGYAFVGDDFKVRLALLESFKAGFIERA